MATILSIFGTRPEVIKIAPLLKAFRHYPDCIHPVTCATGQHREMLTQALDLFDLKPDYSLDVMQANQSLPQLTSILLNELDAVVETVKPDWILAVGDTTTVFVASLVAYYHQMAFGHIEAGLRTGDKYKPYPEEINRRITDQIADLLFAPTERARQALLQEGHAPGKIHVTGNTVVDALMDMAARPYDWVSGPLSVLPEGQRLVVITAHRRESFGAPLYEICMAIQTLAEQFVHDNVHFVYPVHPNPNVKQPVYEWLSDLPNVSLIESLDYLAFVHLMRRATLILTDSGGIQEEAPTFGVPVLVMREATERPEGIEAGVARLVGIQRERIVAETQRLLRDQTAYAAMSQGINPYGDGQAARRIASILVETINR